MLHRRRYWFALALSLIAARLQGELPSLVLSISPQGSPVSLTLKEPSLSYHFRVVAAAEDHTDIRIEVGSLSDSAGKEHPVRVLVEGKEGNLISKIPRFGSVPVTIEANLAEPGTYTGHLSLIYGQKRQTAVPLTVIRPSPVLEVIPDTPVPATGTAVVSGPSEAFLPVSLRETTGQKADVLLPQMLLLTVKGDGEAKFLAPGSLLVRDAGTWQVLGAPIQIDKGVTRQITLEVDGLAGAGRYDGTIRFTPQGAAPVDKTFVLFIRDSWWIAFVSILAGVALSLWLYKYWTKSRPRLVEQRRTQVLLAELEETARLAGLDPRETNLVRALRRELADIAGGLDGEGNLEESSKKLNLLQEKVPLVGDWVRLRREVRNLQPRSLREEFETKLDEIEGTLLNTKADATVVRTAGQTLQDLPGVIERAIKADLQTRLKAFAADLEAKLGAADAALVGVITSTVQPALELAQQSFRAGDVRAALQAFAEAQVAYAAALADDLTARLTGSTPTFMKEEEWARIRMQVEAALAPIHQPLPDPDTVAIAVRRAFMLYLNGLAGALLRRIAADLEEVQNDPAKVATLRALRSRLEIALRSVADEKLDEASREIALAQRDYAEWKRPAEEREARKSQLPAQAVPLGSVPDWLGPLRAIFPAAAPVTPRDMAAAIKRKLQTSDWIATAIVVLIAVGLGLKVLWAPDPAWGGWGDRMVGVLWGLSLHQFTFDGIKGLLARFGG